MKNLNKLTHLFLANLDIENKTVIVGFSGGADSTALIDILSQKKEHFKFNLKAVFFSHGDSPIAQDEDVMLAFCQKYCEERNIEFINVPLDLQKIPRQGWESSGRQARQQFYDTQKADYVFLGHHQDDQNETTMTQLLRGGGKGTVGMVANDGFYCRPFLTINKSDIYDYLNKHELKWIEDPTNQNSEFTRNFWRNEGLPAIEKHYPQYRMTLDKFRAKQSDLYTISYEMACNDGLNEILDSKPVDISTLNNIRLKNLLGYVFPALGKSMEDNFYEQQINHYRANNLVSIVINEKDNKTLIIEKGIIAFDSKPAIKLKF